jgi:hypothetical protein
MTNDLLIALIKVVLVFAIPALVLGFIIVLGDKKNKNDKNKNKKP